MMEIVSQRHYEWFVTGLIVATAVGWTTLELVRLRKTVREDTSDPVVRDKIVGHYVGLAIALLAAVGVVKHYWF